MKKILGILCILLAFSAIAFAEDYVLTCDPQEGVTQYMVEYSGVTEYSTANPDGSANHSIASWNSGNYEATIKAGAPYVLDGVPQEGMMLWSDPTPFVLTVPGKPQLPLKESLELVIKP